MANINTQSASQAVEKISLSAKRVMTACDEMHHGLKDTANQMQTGMADTVKKTAREADQQISRLSNEMKKLNDYMEALSYHVQKYSQCTYRNASANCYHARVTVEEIHRYLISSETYKSLLDRFSVDLQESCGRINHEISGSRTQLENHESSCQTSMRYLKDKILAIKDAIERVEANLANKRRELDNIIREIQAEAREAEKAQNCADSVHIPAYRCDVYKNPDGSTYTRNNLAEIELQRSRRASYLKEAQRHMDKVHALQIKKKNLENEIHALEKRLIEFNQMKAEMEKTVADLNEHMEEVKKTVNKLNATMDRMNKANAEGSQTCKTLQNQADTAIGNLQNAENNIRAYHAVSLPKPHLS